MSFMLRLLRRVSNDRKIQKRRRHNVAVFNKKNRFKNYIRHKNSEVECVKVGLTETITIRLEKIEEDN